MSWQAYVDVNLLGTGVVSKALIAGHDGSPWASSPGFTPSRDELQRIVKLIDSSKPDPIYLCGEKYLTLRVYEGVLYGRKGSEGVACCKTKQALIVGGYSEGMQGGACNNAVESLAEYLIGADF